jgi:hypothetical protein
VKKIDKVIDIISREYLLECISNSVHKNNVGLYYFIQFEAKYEQVALAAFYKDFRILKEDAKQSRKLDTIRSKIEPLLRLGFSILAGGVAKKAMGPAATGFWASTGVVVSGMIAGAGAVLLAKVLFALMKIANDRCRKNCKKEIKEGEFVRRLKLTICASKCKLVEMTKLLRELKKEIRKCNKTKNPEKCKSILMKKAGQYNDAISRETKRLSIKNNKLKKIESDDRNKKPVALTTKTPEIV